MHEPGEGTVPGRASVLAAALVVALVAGGGTVYNAWDDVAAAWDPDWLTAWDRRHCDALAALPDAAPAAAPLRVARPSCSGLGDRLSVSLTAAAGAAVLHRPLFVRWCLGEDTRRYSLQDVTAAIDLPPRLYYVPGGCFERVTGAATDILFDDTDLPAAGGFDGVYTLAARTMRLPAAADAPANATTRRLPVGDEAFTDAWRHAVAPYVKVRSAPLVPAFLAGVQPPTPRVRTPFVVLHVRQGDKLAHEGVRPVEEDSSQTCTHAALSAAARAGWHVELVSDDAAAVRGVRQSHPWVTYRPLRHATPFASLMHDLQLLLAADAIIQHSPHGWSALSSLAAMLRGTPLLNTWVVRPGTLHRVMEFAAMGGPVPEFHTCAADSVDADLQAFVAAVASVTSSRRRLLPVL